MFNLDDITNENDKEKNKKWTYIPDHSYIILIIGSGKTSALLNLTKEQNDIDNIYLYAKDLSRLKYEFMIKKREDAGIKYFNDSNAFIECSNTGWSLWEYWWLQPKQKKKNFNYFWWHDSRHYDK